MWMVAVNRALIRRGMLPPLYSAGVRFEEEPRGTESFIDGVSVLKLARPSQRNSTPHTHWGDCAHLSCWRCAELQEKGEKAAIRVRWRHPVYHVQVRRTKRMNQPGVDDPFVEDPSRLLGMKGPS